MSPETPISLTSFTVAENTLLSWPQLDMAAKRYQQAIETAKYEEDFNFDAFPFTNFDSTFSKY